MRFAHFLSFNGRDEPNAAEVAALAALLGQTPGLSEARIYTPAATKDPYLDDGRPPSLVVQSYFAELQALEAAFGKGGALQGLVAPDLLPSQAGVEIVQEALAVRHYPVPDPVFQTPAGVPHCTYLVSYRGPAQDINAWLTHYINHHPPIMARFPGIRQIEICSRLDWCGALPVPVLAHMQRNKVVFESQAKMNAALATPVRAEMAGDPARHVPIKGATTHFPMNTRLVLPPG